MKTSRLLCCCAGVILSNLLGCNFCIAQDEGPLEDLKYVHEFGAGGSAAGQFDRPRSIAVDEEDRVLVADWRNHRIQVCEEDGSCSTFGGQGSEPGQFNYPFGLAIDNVGHVVVADSQNDRIQICSLQGDCSVLKDADGVERTFDEPTDVAVLTSGRIVITEPRSSSYYLCSVNGDCDTFGDIDGEPNLFARPEMVAVDGQDQIFFVTSLTEIWKCNPQGECEELFGSQGEELGQFSSPGDLEVDDNGRLIITDRGNWRVQICTMEGDCQAYKVAPTTKQLLYWPFGVALDSRNRVLISDLEGNKVQYYERISLQGPLIALNEGMNDAWFDPRMPGQGFFIQVFAQSTRAMFLTWFTFDVERPGDSAAAHLGGPGQRWFTAQGYLGTYQGYLTLYETRDGVFLDESFETGTEPAGELTVRFSDCDEGSISYDLPSIGREGEIPVVRLAADSEEFCRDMAH